MIGTLGSYYFDKFIEPPLTTPDPMALHKIFSDMVDCGIQTVVMEVSAHALYWEKVNGLKFEVGVFTNFSRDHIDFFGNMDNYKKAKRKFFEENECKRFVLNSDDDMGLELSRTNSNVVTYGLENPADVFAISIKEKDFKTEFVLNLFDNIYQTKINFIGTFNVLNALAAVTTAAIIGNSTEAVVKGLEKLDGVKGRIELVYQSDITVVVDYAHTPDGLKKTIMAIKPTCKKRLITVFGCGGNRDGGKREQMGEVSGKLSDFTVITTDNPRFEEPMTIIRQIEKGLLKHSKNYVVIEDRESGIEYALNMAKSGDVVLIAGKGSEQYQEILGVKRLYNDKDTVNELIRRIR